MRLFLFVFLGLLCAGNFPVQSYAGDDLINFSKQQEEALVVKVSVADTIVLEDGRKIKMIGIESAGAPARHYVKLDKSGRPLEEPQDAVIPLEEQAVTYAQSLLEG